MNSLNIIGRLTRDIETKYAASGTAIASFSIAVDIGWGDKKKTAFLDCSMFGKRAESLAQFVSKGKRVALTGSLDFQEWEKNGEKKSKYCMKAEDFTLIERKEDGGQEQPRQEARPVQRQQKMDEVFTPEVDEDDIPF